MDLESKYTDLESKYNILEQKYIHESNDKEIQTDFSDNLDSNMSESDLRSFKHQINQTQNLPLEEIKEIFEE